MDPVSFIVGALASGAASGITKTTGTAIADLYGYLKRLIADRFGVSTDALDKKPESKTQQDALAELLTDAGAGADDDLLKAAQALLQAIEKEDPDAARAVGVDLSRINAGLIDIEEIKTTGNATGVRATDVNANSIRVKGVETEGRATDHP
ncbi:hypothetical protein BB737_05695 [Mycobacterium avium subsp. hominissuis]|uniref:hypothetical protein n=1 Tax=Mycobacterium avium TaxID=1764 RepID=UPI0003927864|nr:hypothetical protein [Mycobacterium avium]ETA99582.1 hypothetical protein O982_06105 [Mycobacterium avium 10-5581]ATO63525.1 hypothetical protein BEP52_15445 [Mycobacterium avium subsp. hominissuis]ATO68064.1 hypothetical protein BJP78_15215 [Mycobacterium avium subsp. hominissuis]ATO72613.1 hypothetical protein BJP74_15135 [Mycobacterium avium subsp. hominissuis]PBJ42969.1 hypothetical protein BI294_02350 [Mycobacterium avium subsp. hominissuis]